MPLDASLNRRAREDAFVDETKAQRFRYEA